ncbi:hypothetical protein F5Y08DRAFT_64156 [Xylaria arbuscula]|nr:hypothetical protein F5Y08DRAFT_64156 [Xylaria arbuscula]
MPPLCDEKQSSRSSGRHRRAPSSVARPILVIGEGLDGGDDDANESDDNISPDADKSDIRFTLERRQGDDDNNDRGNGRNRGDGNRRDRDRSNNDDNEDRRGGRGGDGPGRNRGFREQDDGGGNNGNGNGPGNNRDGNGGGNRGGNRGGDSDSEDDDDENDDGKDGNNNNNGKSDGQGDKDDDNSSTSTSLPPPPPPPPTSTTSAVEAITTTSTTSSTTSVESSTSTSSASTTSVISISTFTPSPEPTVSATSQTSTTSVLIALPDEDPSLVTTSTTLISITASADNTASTPQASPPIFYPVSGSPSPSPPPLNPPDPSNTRNKDNNHHNGDGRSHKGGLSETSERVLIATGSIGVFIVLCFIVWMIYRTIKKSKQPGHTTWVSKLIPWREKPKTNPSAFRGLDDSNESLPAYDAGNRNSMENYGYYEQRKLYPLGSENAVYPSPATFQNETALRQNPGGQPLPTTNYVNSYPQLNDQMIDSNDVDSTIRSRMPDPYYNQSEFARQPSDAYNPAQRQVYRASELSSLSSGFGDGDIIIPPPNIMLSKTQTATRGAAGADGDADNIRPFSWMSRTGPVQQQRDTMYTTASDRRSRFRSVNSWVDQQKRRLKRAPG